MTPGASDASRRAIEQICEASSRDNVLVKSPPGAGKSTLVREVARRHCVKDQVPIVVQTNNQADDLVRGFIRESGPTNQCFSVGRLHGRDYVPAPDLMGHAGIQFSHSIDQLRDCHILVSTVDKWKYIDYASNHWSFAIIDEAYQMRSDKLLPIGTMMDRLLLVGDPGQLDPFTTADETMFRGRSMSPIGTAVSTIQSSCPNLIEIPLPVSWRLAHHTARTISAAFYDQSFVSGMESGDRSLEVTVPIVGKSTITSAIRSAARTGWAYIELEEVIMPNHDREMIQTLSTMVTSLLSSRIMMHDENGSRQISPNDIAVGVTHKDQRDFVRAALGPALESMEFPADSVTVETANVLQGREFQVVLVWHPLSGRRDASAFHLESGRLCVLLSRHRQACIVVSRGGVRQQLQAYPSTEPVWLGEPPSTKDGWHAHMSILDHLLEHRVQ